jgi:hypothetical protein
MLDTLQREGFTARFKDTFGLVKTTLTIFGKDADVIKPIIGMIILQTIVSAATLIGVALIVFASAGGIGSGVIGLLLILLGMVLAPFALFYDAFQRAKVCALGYDVARGEDATIPKAKERIRPIRGTLFLLGLIDLAVSSMKSRSRNRSGIVGIIMAILIAVLAEVWDLISNFLLPAVVIEQKGPREVVAELKELKRNVPAALVGVLGFDAFGSVARGLVFGVWFFLGLIGIGLPLFFFGINPITFVITIVTLMIIIVSSAIISKMVVGAKSVYFTLFYLALLRPHEIAPSMRDACTNLLPAEVAERTKGASQPPGAQASDTDSTAHELARVVAALRAKSGTDEQIRTFLTGKGFAADEVERALKR